MDYRFIKTEKSGSAFIITLNRPDKRNAISTHVMDELMAAAAEAEDDGDMRGIIVTGGDAFFSAGADLNEAQALARPADTLKYLRKWHRTCRAFEENNLPTIAAVEGFCMTGGFGAGAGHPYRRRRVEFCSHLCADRNRGWGGRHAAIATVGRAGQCARNHVRC